MTHGSRKTTILILLAAVMIFILYATLDLTGDHESLASLLTFLAPTSALAFGLLGVNLFGRAAPMNGDRFRSLGLWLGLGLIVLTLAEIAGVVLTMMGPPEMVCFTVGLVQLPGFLLWGLGVIGYLQAVNESLNKVTSERLWPILVFASVMGSLALMAASIIAFPERSPLSILVSAPTVLWFAVIVVILLWLVWTFRNGFLWRPMALLLLGTAICLIRGVLALGTNICDSGFLDDLLAIMAYFVIGAALVEAAGISIAS